MKDFPQNSLLSLGPGTLPRCCLLNLYRVIPLYFGSDFPANKTWTPLSPIARVPWFLDSFCGCSSRLLHILAWDCAGWTSCVGIWIRRGCWGDSLATGRSDMAPMCWLPMGLLVSVQLAALSTGIRTMVTGVGSLTTVGLHMDLEVAERSKGLLTYEAGGVPLGSTIHWRGLVLNWLHCCHR